MVVSRAEQAPQQRLSPEKREELLRRVQEAREVDTDAFWNTLQEAMDKLDALLTTMKPRE